MDYEILGSAMQIVEVELDPGETVVAEAGAMNSMEDGTEFTAKIGSGLTCQKDSFVCASLGTKIGIAFQKRLGAGFFGGEGFILAKLEGDGMAFIHAGCHVGGRRDQADAFGPRRYEPTQDLHRLSPRPFGRPDAEQAATTG